MTGEPFGGTIGRYVTESVPWWPPAQRAPDGAPNIVMLVLDDVGFAQLGCFGSDLRTPTFDALAAGGLRYTNFHTTALCSPTRAGLLTGRNHHSNGMGRVIELATGFPGYNARIPKSNGFLSEILAGNGYATWAVGKWHLTPEDECHLAATRERWPLGRGFERFYGFFGGETNQFAPALIADNHQVALPRGSDDGYHLTEDLIDRCIELVGDLRAIDTLKPFFLYLCFGACHSPHQAPRPWLDSYAGQFDQGWDVWREGTFARQVAEGTIPAHTRLSPRPDWVPAWDSLSRDQQRLYARYMEAFAAFLSHCDHHVGRLVDFLAAQGELDNTLFLVLSDNGASSEGGVGGSLNDVRLWNLVPTTLEEQLARIDEIGGPRCHNNYPWGWTVAGNTPFRRWKREVHEGGVADPLLVHWPRGIAARDQARRQYVHCIDLFSTILDAAGIAAPAVIDGVEQSPIEGVSFASTFPSADEAEVRHTQYYEMFGCRALYQRGWKAVTYHPVMNQDFDSDRWELYNVVDDPSECNDLAAAEPSRLQAMIERWWDEAKRHNVLPLDARPLSDLVLDRPRSVPPRSRYVYLPDTSAVPEAVAVNVRNRWHRITAYIVVTDPPQGVLIAQGSLLGGWSLFIKDSVLRYVHNLAGYEQHVIEATVDLDAGRHELAFTFIRDGDHRGTGVLSVDGQRVAGARIPAFTPLRFSLTGAGLTCGYSGELPVCDDYRAPFRFTGSIERVVVEVDGEPFLDPEGEAQVAVETQ
jgi:arylsulfatase